MKTKVSFFAMLAMVILGSACSNSGGGNNPPPAETFSVADAQGNCTERFVAKFLEAEDAIHNYDDHNQSHGRICSEYQKYEGQCTLNCSIPGKAIQSQCPGQNGAVLDGRPFTDECKKHIGHHHEDHHEDQYED